MSITPTVGRKVWFYREHSTEHTQPIDATVIKVWGAGPNGAVNLSCIDPDTGQSFLRTSVVGGDVGTAWEHYRWMPYQQGQAAKAAAEDAKSSDKSALAKTDDGETITPSIHPYPRFGAAKTD